MTTYITTYQQRFMAAVQALVGKKPPLPLIRQWVGTNEGEEPIRWPLQDWVNVNTRGTMNHIQGIAILDAAHIVAANPDDDENHEPAPETTNPEPEFPEHEAAILGPMFQAWMTTSVTKLVVVVPTVEERIAFIETLQSGLDAVPFFHYAKRLDVKVYHQAIWPTLKEYPYIINLTCKDDNDD